jgi:hypothetical protein
MKKITLFLIIGFLITSSFGQLNAQDKTPDEKKKEKEIEMVIVEQKKAMNEQQKALERLQVDVQVNEDDLENEMQILQDDLENDGVYHIYGKKGMRSFSWDSDAPHPPIPPNQGMMYNFSFGDSEGTRWDFSKSVKENTFINDYSFDVEKSVKSVIMAVNGDCKEGEIRITIQMPDGKNYSDIVLDGFGNLNWRKSFNISETENQDKTGKWKFKIDSKKATGYFKISFQTY